MVWRCVLLFHPDKIEFDQLKADGKEARFFNVSLALGVAEGLDVPILIDADEIVNAEVLDKEFLAYVSSLQLGLDMQACGDRDVSLGSDEEDFMSGGEDAAVEPKPDPDPDPEPPSVLAD